MSAYASHPRVRARYAPMCANLAGGTAGCVLASRLSEDPSVSVLVIEQGPVADTWASRVPVISGDPYRSGTLASTWWALPMEQVDRRSLQVMRGEALGGTSRINSLLYTRGSFEYIMGILLSLSVAEAHKLSQECQGNTIVGQSSDVRGGVMMTSSPTS